VIREHVKNIASSVESNGPLAYPGADYDGWRVEDWEKDLTEEEWQFLIDAEMLWIKKNRPDLYEKMKNHN